MIGMIAAMENEARGVLSAMTVQKTEKIGFATFWQGDIGGTQVVLATCGIGKVFAAACTQAMILNYAPDAILNIGVGGDLSGTLAVGDAVVGTSAVQYDMDTSAIGDPLGWISGLDQIHLTCDQALQDRMVSALEAVGVRYISGVIATADRFVDDHNNRAVCRSFGAVVEDMEGAAVGQICVAHRLPFAVLRTISNGEVDAGAVYQQEADAAAAVLGRVLVRFLSDAKKC